LGNSLIIDRAAVRACTLDKLVEGTDHAAWIDVRRPGLAAADAASCQSNA
jgi:hypothetical protein